MEKGERPTVQEGKKVYSCISCALRRCISYKNKDAKAYNYQVRSTKTKSLQQIGKNH